MGIRTATLLAVVFAALPARADIVLSYHLSSFNGPATADIPDNLPVGPAISSFSLAIGEVKYIQIAIEATAPVLPGQANWTGTNRMPAFIMKVNYPTAFMSQPYVNAGPLLNQNLHNATAQVPFGTGHPNTFPGYNLGSTVITGTDTAGGIGASGGILPPRVLATLKFVGTAVGSGQLSITEHFPQPTAAEFGLLDGTNLDPIVFAPAHANFPMSFSVTAVPEPSALALSGCTVAAIGWRRLRRGNVATKS